MRKPLLASILLALPLIAADALPSSARKHLELYAGDQDIQHLNDALSSSEVGRYVLDRTRIEGIVNKQAVISKKRFDTHLGSPSLNSGSTSVVALPSVTEFISAALESGAVSRKTDNNAVTFQFNALPLEQLLTGQKPVGCGTETATCESGTGRWIRGLSGGVTLNTTSKDTPIPKDAGILGILRGGQKIASLSLRYELFVRERGSKLGDNLKIVADTLSAKVADVLSNQEIFETELDKVLATLSWQESTKKALLAAPKNVDDLAKVLLERYRLAYLVLTDNVDFQTKSKISDLIAARTSYVGLQNGVLAEHLYRKSLTFDFVNQRPSDQPQLNQFRLVFASPIGRKNSDVSVAPTTNLTFNAGVTLYPTIPTGVKSGRIRDAQLSSLLQWKLGKSEATAALAGYFQYMLEDAVIQFSSDAFTPEPSTIPLPKGGIEVLKTKGVIGIGQFRFNFPIGNSGVAFPIAVSYSNRTELITGKPFWQGHFGVTYDLDKLKDLFKSSN